MYDIREVWLPPVEFVEERPIGLRQAGSASVRFLKTNPFGFPFTVTSNLYLHSAIVVI